MADSILKIIFQGDTDQLDKSLKNVGSKLDNFNKKASALGSSLSTKLTLPLAIAGGAAIKLASDFEESLNKVDVAFGSSQKAVRDFAQTSLTQFGIAEGSALDMAALFGDMATSMGMSQQAAASMSTELVGLAGDLASFKNIDIEQATTALAGVFTGETESLKRLGIVMTEVNLQQFAMEKGLDKSVKKMTQAEKVALRYEFIMSKTANAQGDFSRTSDGAANQMRIFQESLKELGVSFGQILLPAFTKLVTKLNEIIQGFNDTSPEVKGFITVIGLLAGAVGPLLLSIPKLTKTFKLLTLAMKANPIIAVASALASVAFAIYDIAKAKKEAKLDEFSDSLEGLSRKETLAKLGELNKKLNENNKIIHGSAKIAEKSQAKKENKLLAEQIKIANQRLLTLRQEADQKRILNQELEKNNKKTETAATRQKVFTVNTIEANTALQELGLTTTIVGETLTKSLEPAVQKTTQFGKVLSFVGEELPHMFAAAFESMMNGESFIKSLGRMIIGLIKKLVAAAAAALVLSTLLGGIGISKIGSTVTSFKGIFGSITGFAKGGIVSTPTLGLMGEYPGARSNPEVIAPLDKLQGMIANTGGSKVEVGGQFVLKGQDLVVALQRADRNRNRIK
jgi:hypothetical protein|tara:strand:- start:492 stop:2366 length:1875 start_codon:yes stop_codon:yes gene_type:complete